MQNLIVAVVAYLIGSVSFAVVVSAAMGLDDPRSYGSGNPGATNVLRSGSKKAAILTLIGDAFKGWLPVWFVVHFGARYGLDETSVAIASVAVFLGHLYPVFFRFKGGKGVATAAGVLLAINPMLGVATLLTWLIVAFFYALFVAGGIGRGGVRAVLRRFPVRAACHRAGDRRDEFAAGVAPSRQHRQADARAGKPHRR